MIIFLSHPQEIHPWNSFDSVFQCEEVMKQINSSDAPAIAFCTDEDFSDVLMESPI